jgi:hypothetical protein
MRLALRFTHGASPEPPEATCAELLRLANLMGVVAEITVNGCWDAAVPERSAVRLRFEETKASSVLR